MKPANSIEFGVVKVQYATNGVVVEGRCHIGPIYVGQMFTVVSTMTVEVTPEVCGPTTLHPLSEVKLRVDSIWAYGRQIEELPSSMTARLELTGAGAEKIQPDSVLS